MVKNPFTGGFENLTLLFSKNIRQYMQLKHISSNTRGSNVSGRDVLVIPGYTNIKTNPNSSSKGSGGRRSATSSTAVEPAAQLRALLIRFVHLHGYLFHWTSRMHREYAQLLQLQSKEHSIATTTSPTAAESTSMWLSPITAAVAAAERVHSHDDDEERQQHQQQQQVDSQEYARLLRVVLEEYDQQLSSGALSDALLVRMIAICLFSVHYAVAKEDNLLACNNATNSDNTTNSSSVYNSSSSSSIHSSMTESQSNIDGSNNNNNNSSSSCKNTTHRHSLPHTVTESLALQMLYGIINRYVINMLQNMC